MVARGAGAGAGGRVRASGLLLVLLRADLDINHVVAAHEFDYRIQGGWRGATPRHRVEPEAAWRRWRRTEGRRPAHDDSSLPPKAVRGKREKLLAPENGGTSGSFQGERTVRATHCTLTARCGGGAACPGIEDGVRGQASGRLARSASGER